MEKEGKPLQEIIESYEPPFLRGYGGASVAFQIEGNFTGSGNREIIAGYERAGDRSGYGVISGFACFVCDSSGEKIESVYNNAFLSEEMTYQYEPKTGLSEVLGSYIVYRGRRIGCYGDFNRNGKDELCIFTSGMYFRPYFFEFKGFGFVELIPLDEWPEEIIITDINPEERIITLQTTRIYDITPADVPPDTNMSIEISSYVWDEAAQQYIVLSSETKYYRWNRTTRKYEEIVE
jgi:hypothetical protein